MGNWLKGLLATACVVVIGTGSNWSYYRNQQRLNDMRTAQVRSEEAGFASCKQMVERAIPGKGDITDALSCSRLFSQLSRLEQAHQGAIQYRQRSKERSQLEQAEKQHIKLVKKVFFQRETAARGSSDEACFIAVHTMYEFGMKDVLYTILPTDKKIMAVKKILRRRQIFRRRIHVFQHIDLRS